MSDTVDSQLLNDDETSLEDVLEYIDDEIQYMIRTLEQVKNRESGPVARYLAIVITDLEKVYAFQKTFLNPD